MLGMARLTDIDQKVFVTICDETRGGMLYEIQLSIGELLEKSLSDFTPQVVDAIPVVWLREFDLYYAGISGGTPYMNELVKAWQHEQEAQDG